MWSNLWVFIFVRGHQRDKIPKIPKSLMMLLVMIIGQYYFK